MLKTNSYKRDSIVELQKGFISKSVPQDLVEDLAQYMIPYSRIGSEHHLSRLCDAVGNKLLPNAFLLKTYSKEIILEILGKVSSYLPDDNNLLWKIGKTNWIDLEHTSSRSCFNSISLSGGLILHIYSGKLEFCVRIFRDYTINVSQNKYETILEELRSITQQEINTYLIDNFIKQCRSEYEIQKRQSK